MGSPLRAIERRNGRIGRKQGPKGTTACNCVDLGNGDGSRFHYTKGFKLSNKVKREIARLKAEQKALKGGKK